MSNQVPVRLKREVEKLIKNPPSGISCYPKDDSMKSLCASIIGVPGSPYENGLFKIEVDIPDKYPFEPPRLRFVTKVYHPNIDDSGRICLDLLKPQPKGTWRPTVMLEGLLIAVQYLLGQPNPDDPLMPDIANEFRFNRSDFERKAKEWTAKNAVK